MPPPFQRRPSLGSRLVVQANFGRTCPALCGELQGWMQGLKLRSAQLLRSSLVYLEDHVATHLHLLLPALAKVRSVPCSVVLALVFCLQKVASTGHRCT
jgi:hypothetical protein